MVARVNIVFLMAEEGRASSGFSGDADASCDPSTIASSWNCSPRLWFVVCFVDTTCSELGAHLSLFEATYCF
jgi:hypothetical protein